MKNAPRSEQVRRLVAHSGEELGWLAAFVRAQPRLWRSCARRLRENNLTAMSAALSFQTIFALIPMLVLGFLAARALGVLEDSKTTLRNFLATSGFTIIATMDKEGSDVALTEEESAPAKKVINVAEEIESLVQEVERKLTFNRVGPIGAALFIWTALTLLTTIEQALNRVFQAASSRSMGRRVMLYWSAMTLSPIALAIASYLGRQALERFRSWSVLSWFLAAAGWVGPIVVGVLVLAAIYILIPNTRVSRRAALGGAFVAVMLWTAGKWAFSLYVRHMVVGGNLYGILGVLPLFMMWLYFSWMIFLFGAELANTAANINQIWHTQDAEPAFVTPTDALAVTLAVAQAFESGQGPAPVERIAAQVRMPEDAVRALLDRLVSRELVCAIDGEEPERYVLGRPPHALRVSDVLEVGERRAPQGPIAARSGDLAAVAADVDSRMRETVSNLTVADLLANKGAEA